MSAGTTRTLLCAAETWLHADVHDAIVFECVVRTTGSLPLANRVCPWSVLPTMPICLAAKYNEQLGIHFGFR